VLGLTLTQARRKGERPRGLRRGIRRLQDAGTLDHERPTTVYAAIQPRDAEGALAATVRGIASPDRWA